MSRNNLISVLVCYALLLGSVECELFTAIAHMEGLLGLESELLHTLNSYITREKSRLAKLEAFANQVTEIHGMMDESDPTSHLHNPVNSLHLVGRFTHQWRGLADLVLEDNSQELISNLSVNNYRLPTEEDFNGAMTAIMRLQDTYDLEPQELASGNLGKQQSLSMSALDCYRIGQQAYQQKSWRKVSDWMKEAINRSDDGSDLDLVSLYDLLSFSEFLLGNYEGCAFYTEELLKHDPNLEIALSNKATMSMLQETIPEEFVDNQLLLHELMDNTPNMSEREAYEATCREGRPYPPELERKLTCFYSNGGNNPRLIIQPVKVEVAYLDPDIYILRDIITDKEMERLKELGGPAMTRAGVDIDSDGYYKYDHFRISKIAWLSPSDDDQGYLAKIDQRIEDFTGLSMETAEPLQRCDDSTYSSCFNSFVAQVCNYGIGGHYEPHYDFARDSVYQTSQDPVRLQTGNRIATVLLYISDVEKGGATAFTKIGLRIAPSKGDAAFWWNLKKSGEGDLQTLHAGCPVLVGSKWVCNKWIHERGQEFRRPCGISEDL